ncbi:hypothetical protein ABZU76_45195 [Amycolatopsis sp. NPDC005232]|uniref:hypothetical protein n=1 Tax=Amycolatopsis sp. NPDC005232 TaxID=3157027 RepID=UPI0033A656D1
MAWTFWPDTSVRLFGLRQAGALIPLRPGISVREGDDFGHRSRDFAAQALPPRKPPLSVNHLLVNDHYVGVDWRKSPRSTGEVLDAMREVLREMAATHLSDEEIRRAKRRPRKPRFTGYEERLQQSRERSRPAGPLEVAQRLYAADSVRLPPAPETL